MMTSGGRSWWWKRAAATASWGVMPKSMTFMMAWNTEVKIVDPPGVPTTMATAPSSSRIVGVMDDSMRLPGWISFASLPTTPYAFGTPGLMLKSSISLFSRNPAPVTTTPLPKPRLSV